VSRIVKHESAGKDRNQLCKGIVISIRELRRQERPNEQTHDLTAFIVLALESIAKTIEESVAAWEKRDYWVKADRFRMEWSWAAPTAKSLRQAILGEDWGKAASIIASIAAKMTKVKVSEHHRMGKPWEGAWERLRSNSS
jgi:hypothetical protein